MTKISPKTEEQVRAELSKRTKEDLELIADVHILFKDDAPPGPIRNHFLRKRIARELLDSGN